MPNQTFHPGGGLVELWSELWDEPLGELWDEPRSADEQALLAGPSAQNMSRDHDALVASSLRSQIVLGVL